MVDIEKELGELAEVVASIRQLASGCIDRFRDAASDDARYLMAERLPAVGSILLPALTAIVEDPDSSPTLRYLAAWIAVGVGDRGASAKVLSEEVLRGSEWSVPAANALARYRVYAAVENIAIALDRASMNFDNPDVAQYSAALRDLGGAILASTRQRLPEADKSWIVQAVRADFPDD